MSTIHDPAYRAALQTRLRALKADSPRQWGSMTPSQMLTFGEMYRNGGQANGRQILSKRFIEESFEPRGRSRISGREYGYGWWMREMAGRQAYYAWGFGGQYIYIVPSLDLTVVTTSAATVSEDRRDHRRTVDEIVEQLVVRSLTGG